MFRRLGIFKSLLISYALITFIPLGVFLVLMGRSIQHSYDKEIYTNLQSEIARKQEFLDLRVEECQNLTLQMSKNLYLSKYNLTQSVNSALTGIEELRKYKAGSEYLIDLGIYFLGNDRIYTYQGATTVGNTLIEYFQVSTEDIACIETLLNEVFIPTGYFSVNKQKFFLLIPRQVNYPKKYVTDASMIYVYGNSFFSGFEDSWASNDSIGIDLVMDGNRNILYLADKEGKISADTNGTLQEIIAAEHLDRRQRMILYNGQHFWVASSPSTKLDFICVSLYPIYGRQRLMQEWYLLIAAGAIVILVCTMMSAWFADRYWAPIQELSYMVTGSRSRDKHWDSIQSAVRYKLHENMTYSQQLKLKQAALRENILLRLLQGSPDEPVDMAQTKEALHIAYPVTGCCVAIILPHQAEEQLPEGNQNIIDKINRLREGFIYAVETRWNGGISVVLLTEEQGVEQSIHQAVNTMLNTILAITGKRFAVGIGKVVPSIMDLRKSYLQAKAALTHESAEWTDDSSGHIIYFDQIAINSPMLPELRERELFLSMALKQGDEELALNMLDEILEYAAACVPAMTSFACYRLIDLIMTYASDTPHSEQADGFLSLNTFIECMNRSRINEFKLQMGTSIRSICAYSRRAAQIQEDSLVRHILDFTQAHCFEKTFSLDELTNMFGSSVYYWSRFFKERIGINFTDYIWNLRLSYAKQLLSTTTKTIKEIAEEVGYFDTRSFIRKFKSQEGVTPNQYRSIYK